MRFKGVVDILGKSVLEILFPIHCVGCSSLGTWFCTTCSRDLTFLEVQICAKCKRQVFSGFTHTHCITRYSPERLISVFPYRGPIKGAIKQLKYRQVLSLCNVLASYLLDYFEKYLIYFPSDFILVPVPLNRGKSRKRTFNQSEEVANKISRKLGLRLKNNLLKRVKETQSQTELTCSERIENVKNAFVVPDSKKGQIVGSNMILVDDVWTTGATALEACRVLKKAGVATVWVLTVARG